MFLNLKKKKKYDKLFLLEALRKKNLLGPGIQDNLV